MPEEFRLRAGSCKRNEVDVGRLQRFILVVGFRMSSTFEPHVYTDSQSSIPLHPSPQHSLTITHTPPHPHPHHPSPCTSPHLPILHSSTLLPRCNVRRRTSPAWPRFWHQIDGSSSRERSSSGCSRRLKRHRPVPRASEGECCEVK